MQNRTKQRHGDKRKKVLRRLSAICIAASLMLSLQIGTRFPTLLKGTAMFSASLVLPHGSAKRIQAQIQKNAQGSQPVSETVVPPQQLPDTVQQLPQVTDTPPDILQMMEDAKAVFASAQRAGTIVEKQYGRENATDTFENITVRNTTASHSISIAEQLEKRATLSVSDKSAPTVLIFHTHTTESYEDLNYGWYTTEYRTRDTNPNRNTVRVGKAICAELAALGIGFIHDTEIHDHQYTGAYARSRESIDRILAENPSIQIVLDVHRDAIRQKDGTRIKPTAEINGKKAAQIMIITGCEDGKVKDFPRWEENLTFALQLQQIAETEFSGLMRPILFSARKYNMDVTPCSLLLEMGSDSNTLEEAEYAGHLIGKAIGALVLRYTNEGDGR